MNHRRMILKMHHAVERNHSTFGMGKRTGLAWPKDMTAVEMPLQRKFTTKVIASLVQS